VRKGVVLGCIFYCKAPVFSRWHLHLQGSGVMIKLSVEGSCFGVYFVKLQGSGVTTKCCLFFFLVF